MNNGKNVRYYLGQCEYKWSHRNTNLEQLWVRREVGEEIFRTVESNAWDWVLIRSGSQTLPSDVYCRCDIYVDVNPDSPQHTVFALQHSHIKSV